MVRYHRTHFSKNWKVKGKFSKISFNSHSYSTNPISDTNPSLNIQKPPSTNRDTGNTSPENDKQETPKTNTQSNKNDEPFPDNVQTAKERECYRLYQKMSSMGLNVSFDTVLRGMLTPTELRVIQKKKDSEMARQATIDRELEEQQENESTKSSNGVNEQK